MTDAPNQKDETLRTRRMTATAMSLGIQLAVGMVVFASLGYYADRRSGGGTRWTLLGIFFGLFYCAYEIWKLVRIMQADDHAEGGGDGGA